MQGDEERVAFEAGYAIGAAEFMAAVVRKGRGKNRERSYDRWLRLGRDVRLYLASFEYLDAEGVAAQAGGTTSVGAGSGEVEGAS